MKINMNASLYARIREAVHKRWDPIGVADYSNEMGEYDGYVYNLFELLEKQPSRDQIFNFLWEAETESMGLSGDRKSTEDFADWLYELIR